MEHRITALEARWDAVFPTLATKGDLAELRVELRDALHHSAMATRAPPSEMQQACSELLADMRKLGADIKSWTRATVVAIIGTMLAALLGISLFDRVTPPPSQIIIITLPSTPPTK